MLRAVLCKKYTISFSCSINTYLWKIYFLPTLYGLVLKIHTQLKSDRLPSAKIMSQLSHPLDHYHNIHNYCYCKYFLYLGRLEWKGVFCSRETTFLFEFLCQLMNFFSNQTPKRVDMAE